MTEFTYVPAEEIEKILNEAEKVRPDNAKIVITGKQKIWLSAFLALAVLLLVINPMAITLVVGICVLGFTAQFALKSYLAAGSINALIQVSKAQLDANHDWPFYTVLVPLRGEAAVIEQLVESMQKLDYPRDRLEVILLLEENDPSTVEAAQKIQFPEYFQVLVLADAGPRTKPKACNVGLYYAHGKYIVVYDAEDKPERDQLKKVVVAFKALGNEVWCIQGKLEYHNGAQNFLTRLFSAEYITHFNLTLPALGNQNLLVALGGTTNNLRKRELIELGGWDSHNVTEDLDLGVQIKRKGGFVKLLDTITWEEANARAFGKGSWVSQRSRWIKGHMQTWLLHMRNPWQLYKELGFQNFLLFQLIILGSPLSLLLSPIFLGLTGLYAASRTIFTLAHPEAALVLQQGIEALFPASIYYLAMISFIVGNLGIMYTIMIGCLLRKEYSTVKYIFLAPLYWLLMSIATWKAAYQLITKPHYWEKTSHGHSPVVIPAQSAVKNKGLIIQFPGKSADQRDEQII